MAALVLDLSDPRPDPTADRPDDPPPTLEMAPPRPPGVATTVPFPSVQGPSPDLSLVIALRDEAPNIETLMREIAAWLAERPRRVEVIAVDDGSSDATLGLLEREASWRPWLLVVPLGRAAGKGAALRAGFRLARAPIVATMDGDLQDDPFEIDTLLQVLDPWAGEQGAFAARTPDAADLVVGWRRVRRDGFLRRAQTFVWAASIRRFGNIDLHDPNCGLKVMRREVAVACDLYGGRHRVLAPIAAALGFRVRERPVLHRERRRGRSKVGLGRVAEGLVDLVALAWLARGGERLPARMAAIGLAAATLGAIAVGGAFGALSVDEAAIATLAGGLGALALASGVALLASAVLFDLVLRPGAAVGDAALPIERVREEPAAAATAPATLAGARAAAPPPPPRARPTVNSNAG